MKCTIVGIAGGSGSGKTTLCKLLADSLGERCLVISSDDYYRPNDHLTEAERAQLNFDHPDSLELDLLARHLVQLQQSEPVSVPKYCFSTHTRLAESQAITPRPVVFVEGVLVLAHAAVRQAMDVRIFVDADDTLRFQRRLERDVVERRRTKECVTEQWNTTVAPMYDQFVAPTRDHAHLVVNSNEPNEWVLRLLTEGIRAASGR